MIRPWQAVTTLPTLNPDEVQLWHVGLSDVIDRPDLYSRLLSPVELDRADRLRAGQVRMQFIIARSALRVLLGNLLSVPANQVPITLSAYGKPEVASLGGPTIFFSIAHSRETILIALSRSSRVGVDVEYIDREIDVLGIARSAFSSNEFRLINSVKDPIEKQRGFFRCWTRKEAVIKADGRGLSIPLDSVEIPVIEVATSVPVLVSKGSQDGTSSGRWFVTDIVIQEEVCAAIAIGFADLSQRTFRFPLALLASSQGDGRLAALPTTFGG